MKDNKIDDLFRKGLTSHKISAPSNAWDKIEAQLPKESKKGFYFWLSIAASILLVFSFSWILLSNSTQDNPTGELKADNATIEKTAPVKDPQPSDLDEPSKAEPKQGFDKDFVQQSTQVEEPTTQMASLTERQKSISQDDVTVPIKRTQLELLRIDPNRKPEFLSLENFAKNNSFIMPPTPFEKHIKSFQSAAEVPSKKKRFSLFGSIVSVAKGVNSGKIAISEIRKSKNEFINNDLNYGSTEGEDDEDIEDDPKRDQDDINRK